MFEKMMAEPGYMEDFMSSMFKFIYDKLKNKKQQNIYKVINIQYEVFLKRKI